MSRHQIGQLNREDWEALHTLLERESNSFNETNGEVGFEEALGLTPPKNKVRPV